MPASNEQSPIPQLQSVRGLIVAVNRRGERVGQTTLRQWLRLSAEKFKAQKVDVYLPKAEVATLLPLLEEGRQLDLRLSLRCTSETTPAILHALADGGLLDVALEPDVISRRALAPWFEAASEAELPLRLFLDGAKLPPTPDDALVDCLAQAASVRIALHNGLDRRERPRRLPEECIDRIVALAGALAARGTETHCLDIPFCWVPEARWPHLVQGPQMLAHHQHYRLSSRDFAQKTYGLSPDRIHQAVEISLADGTSFHNRIDDAVLPWILERPWYFFWLWFLHKLTRRLLPRRPEPKALPEEITALEGALARYTAEQRTTLGPVCAECALHPICDHHTEGAKQRFPGRAVSAIAGAVCYDPRRYLDEASTWYDAVDAARTRCYEGRMALYDAARHRISRTPPTREIAAESYRIQDHKTHRMPASVRWFSFSTAELQSTVLARLSPPFTLSVTVGGGIAQYMGFAFGRHSRLVCPMTAFDHKLTLHVDDRGYYVLLRDGEPVHPVAFEERDLLPERLGTVVEPRIALQNIDGQIVTQTVLLWEGPEVSEERPPCTHSVVVVCTRYARRLQAALLALAHQQGLQDGALEVLVGYVPGIDATDDVLDSLEQQCPTLRLVRMPFGAQHSRAKGFIINECLDLARGAWITLLDADIMLPPDYFQRLDGQPESATFVVPDGRHMLSPETTAAILLGLERPWESYEALLESPGEYRHHESDGVPPGFCQSARRAVFEAIRYQELDHFEGSDWWFSAQVIEKFGKETRLSGLRVLHLDHGGSQWYGTDKQF